jgi:hypothetical protein
MNGERLTIIARIVFEFVKSNRSLIRTGLVVLAVLGLGSAFRWSGSQRVVVFLLTMIWLDKSLSGPAVHPDAPAPGKDRRSSWGAGRAPRPEKAPEQDGARAKKIATVEGGPMGFSP